MAEKNFMTELLEILNSKKLEETKKEVTSLKRKIKTMGDKLDQLQKDIINKAKAPVVEEPVIEEPIVEEVPTIEEVPAVETPTVEQAPTVEEIKVEQEETAEPKEEVEVKKEEPEVKKEVITETKVTASGTVVVTTTENGTKRRFLQITEKPKREYRPDNKDNKADRKTQKPQQARQGQDKKPQGQVAGVLKSAPVQEFIPKDNNQKNAHNKQKKSNGKTYEDKKAPNKRALAKEQLFQSKGLEDEESGYRKVRKQKNKEEKQANVTKIEHAVITKEEIPIKELSEKIGISAVEITKLLFKEMIMKTINDSIPFETAQYIASEVGVELEIKLAKTAEERLSEAFSEQADDQTAYVKRPPIVTVMGHVDHGKTSLLDRIRSANVTSGEAGGITQHIGAYTVTLKSGEKITFIDTPGHAAFTQMRARGAQITDLAILVIAADDGIMPQTIEAINHAKSAGVPIIIAANKIDKQTANIDRIRQQLTEHEILVEDYGGDVILCPVSAKTGEGIDNLLDSILLMADLKDLKANPEHAAKGTIVEAKLDKGKGPVANVIVLNGTLRTGDSIVAGTITGKVRAMTDDKGKLIKEAGPSTPVSIIGLSDVPNAGDALYAVKGDDKELLKMVAEERKNKERQDLIKEHKMSYEDAITKMAEGELKNFNVIVKADVQGSVEAVKDSLIKLSGDEVKVTIVHSGVGAINETDVTLADSSNSVIVGFNVRPDAKAKVLAERSKVSIKIYRIIYEAIEDVQNAMKGLVVPKFQDVYVGKAEVKQTFKIKGVGVIAGCVVSDGKVVRNGKLMIYRDDVKICEGNVLTLKHYKDEVKEVSAGSECGISIENFNEIKVGDYIECYIEEEIKA